MNRRRSEGVCSRSETEFNKTGKTREYVEGETMRIKHRDNERGHVDTHTGRVHMIISGPSVLCRPLTQLLHYVAEYTAYIIQAKTCPGHCMLVHTHPTPSTHAHSLSVSVSK